VPVIKDDHDTEEISGMETDIWLKHPWANREAILGIRPLLFKPCNKVYGTPSRPTTTARGLTFVFNLSNKPIFTPNLQAKGPRFKAAIS
jgi:hypothetical protein